MCLSDGEAAGEGIEVRGAGTGHWRIGSSLTCPLSFSAIINSMKRDNKLIQLPNHQPLLTLPKSKFCMNNGPTERSEVKHARNYSRTLSKAVLIINDLTCNNTLFSYILIFIFLSQNLSHSQGNFGIIHKEVRTKEKK